VVDNHNGTITIQYKYPTETDWHDAGEPIPTGNALDKAAILSIVDAGGVITITMNDGTTEPPKPNTEFEFAKASTAVRFEIMGLSTLFAGVGIFENTTLGIRFMVNPSTAWIPTGTGDAIKKWELNAVGNLTRAGYVKPSTIFSIESILPANTDSEGEYIATILCGEYDAARTAEEVALVLNTGTDAEPELVSSASFPLTAKDALVGGTDNGITWALTDDGTLYIDGTGEMADYDGSYPAWYGYRTQIKKVVIGPDVTTIGDYSFNNYDSLESVTIGADVTTIGRGAFQSCGNLESVTIGAGVTTIGKEAFHDCETLKSINIPDGVKTIGDRAFANCDDMTSVTIGAGVTTIGEWAFHDCDTLKSINIPDGVKSIGRATFMNCGALESVTIGNGLTIIGATGFYACTKLASVIIPSGVTSIGEDAFGNCRTLTSVTCLAVEPPTLDKYNFDEVAVDVLYIPSGSVEAYKGVAAWNDAFSSIVAIE
jgi:hypothetical protein